VAKRTRKRKKSAQAADAEVVLARRVRTGKRGKPPVEIDPAKFGELLEFGLTLENVATLCGVHRDTLYAALERDEELRAARDRALATRNQNLLACMWQGAREGNAALCIFLSKQWLGFTDRKAIEVSGPEGGPLPISGDLGVAKLEERLAALIARRERRERSPQAAPVG
jgi:hypothetical protein